MKAGQSPCHNTSSVQVVLQHNFEAVHSDVCWPVEVAHQVTEFLHYSATPCALATRPLFDPWPFDQPAGLQTATEVLPVGVPQVGGIYIGIVLNSSLDGASPSSPDSK